MISIIVAIAKNNVIGGNNKLLWHLSDDLKRFKSITTGATIIMGRKTFESLPGILPNRKHVVITRDENYKVDSPMVEIVHSIDDIKDKYATSKDEVFIIGGGEIYASFLPIANKLYLTLIDKDFEGDTKFPVIDFSNWELEFKSEDQIDTKSGLKYHFVNYKRSAK